MIGAQLVTADGEVLELGPGRNGTSYGRFAAAGALRRRYATGFPAAPAADPTFGKLPVWVEQHRGRDADLWRDHSRDAGRGARVVPRRERHWRRGQLRALWRSGCRDRLPREVEGQFRSVEPQMGNSIPTPQGEVWAAASLAVDGAFLEGMTDDGLVDVLARAAVAGRGVGAMLMGLSNGVASRIGMTDTATAARRGLGGLLSAEWHRPEERARAEQWVVEYGAALRPWARRAYVNYLAPSSQERIREVYGVNYSRLARIKAQLPPRESVPLEPECFASARQLARRCLRRRDDKEMARLRANVSRAKRRSVYQSLRHGASLNNFGARRFSEAYRAWRERRCRVP